jgi:hypothetical protein
MRTLLTQTFCLVCNTQKLLLNGNKIGDAGMVKFSEALVGGALANCKILQLGRNQIGYQGMIKFSEALATGAMPQLRELLLFNNKIGDAGVEALAKAAATGAMAHLTVSSRLTALSPCLETWHARSPGLAALVDVPHVPYAGARPARQ